MNTLNKKSNNLDKNNIDEKYTKTPKHKVIMGWGLMITAVLFTIIGTIYAAIGGSQFGGLILLLTMVISTAIITCGWMWVGADGNQRLKMKLRQLKDIQEKNKQAVTLQGMYDEYKLSQELFGRG